MNAQAESLVTILVACAAGLSVFFITSRILLKPNPPRSRHSAFVLSARTFDGLFVLGVAARIVAYSAITVLSHLSIHTGTDLGLYDQLVWNTLHGRLFENTLISDAPFYLGKSFSPIIAALVPLYAIWADPISLLVLQTIVLSTAAFPIYWFARERVGPVLALVLSVAYLLSPAVESINMVDFHGIALATPALAFATFFLLRRHYTGFFVCLGVALLIREEIALIAIGFGIYLFLFQNKRRLGLALTLCAGLLSLLLLTYIIPFFRGAEFGPGFYYFGSGASADAATRYTYLGHNLTEIVVTVMTRPDILWQHVVIPEKIDFVLQLLVPLGFLSLIGLEVTALALPTLGYSLLSTFSSQYSILSFYQAPLVPFLYFGAVVGMDRVVRWGHRHLEQREERQRAVYRTAWNLALGMLVLVAAGSSYYLVAFGPFTRSFQMKTITVDTHAAAFGDLTRRLPPGAVVVAQTELVPHLSQRRLIYDFPAMPDYRQADFLFADTTQFWYNFHKPSWDYYLNTGYFRVTSQQDGYIVAARSPMDHSLAIRYGDQMTLLGYTLPLTETRRGGTLLRPIVQWRAEKNIAESYKFNVRVVDIAGHVWAQEDREPDDGFSPTNQWQPSGIIGDQFSLPLPPTMPPGNYSITMSVHSTEANEELNALDERGNSLGVAPTLGIMSVEKDKSSITASQLEIANPYRVDMQELRLLGYVFPERTISKQHAFRFGIYWRALDKPQKDYFVGVQVRDTEGRVVFEQSSQPANGAYPTDMWAPGEVLLDWHDLYLPADVAGGGYQLAVVLRDGAHGQVLGEAELLAISVVD